MKKTNVNINPQLFIKLLKIFTLPIMVFILHVVLSLGFKVYQILPWFDILEHVLGGFVIAHSFILSLKFFQKKKLVDEMNNIVKAIFIFTLVSTAAVFWEIGEFTIDFIFKTRYQAGLADTMLDVLLGMSGGLVSILLFKKHL